MQDKLLQTTEAIGERLEYFQELENATRMLNHPGESLVLQTDFLYMVERVDICIDYLKSHVSSRFSIGYPNSKYVYSGPETLPRGGNLSPPFPTMSNTSHDPDQDVLRRLPTRSHI
jgi:hypothetical protein